MQNTLKDLTMVVTLAGFGGFIRSLIDKNKLKNAIVEIFIAIFAGLIVYWFFQEYQISSNLRAIAISLAGYSARGIILVLDCLVISKCKEIIGIFSNKDSNEQKNSDKKE